MAKTTQNLKQKSTSTTSERNKKKIIKSKKSLKMKKYFSEHNLQVQRHILSLTLKNLEISELISMRPVCHLWDSVVHHHFCKQVTALVVHLKVKEEKCILWGFESRAHYDANVGGHFDALVADEIKPNHMKELTIQEADWNDVTIAGIGKLFGHIKHLTIYDETNYPILVDKYCTLLPMLPNVRSFSLIISNSVNSEFVTRLFKVINDHLALNVLHLYFSLHLSLKKEDYPRLAIGDLDRTLPWLSKFSFICNTANPNILLRNVGRNLDRYPPIVYKPLQCLSLQARKLQVDDIEPLFEFNQELVRLKQLQLINIERNKLNVVERLLANFTQLESLQLCYLNYRFALYTSLTLNLLTSISRLAHLRELKLCGFQVCIPKNGIVSEPALQVRRLTIVRRNLFIDYLYDWWCLRRDAAGGQEDQEDLENAHILRDVAFEQLVILLDKIFPNIEELTIHANMRWIGPIRDKFNNWLTRHFRKLKKINMINID